MVSFPLLDFWVNFKLGSKLLRCSKNVFNLSSPCVQTKMITSMYLKHRFILLAFDQIGFKFAHKNACIIRCTFSFYCSIRYVILNCTIKALFLRTLPFSKFFNGNRFIFPSINSVLESLQSSNRGLQGYNPITPAVTKIASFGMFLILFILSIKSPQSLM